MKIAVIGYSGAGKSTLARMISEKSGLPLLYLDRIQFTSGWVERDREEALALVDAFLEADSWVIDGTYPSFRMERRMEEADRILFLDFDRFTCLKQAFGRYLSCRGTVRESAADGCTEKFDWEFLRWLLWEGRTKKRATMFQNIVTRWSEKTVILKNRRQVEAFLQTM